MLYSPEEVGTGKGGKAEGFPFRWDRKGYALDSGMVYASLLKASSTVQPLTKPVLVPHTNAQLAAACKTNTLHPF